MRNQVEKAEKERKLKLSFRFVPTPSITDNSKKKVKKMQKIKKPLYGVISSQNKLEKAEKDKK